MKAEAQLTMAVSFCSISNISTTTILKPGPVIDFLKADQNVLDEKDTNWEKAKKTLKILRVKTEHLPKIFTSIGPSENPCNQQLLWKLMIVYLTPQSSQLVVGDNKELIPQNGCWNFINKSFIQVVPIRNWIIVSFCAVGFKLEDISHQLVNHGKYKHFEVNPAAGFYEEEDPDNRRNPLDRVEKMFHRIPPESYDFILCLAEEEKY